MQKFACLLNEAWPIQSTARLVGATLFLLVVCIWVILYSTSV